MRIIILLTLLSFNAFAKPLISDISNNEILIDARFSGQKLFLFGARNLAGDVVVVIRGPEKNYIVRKKENVAGIWLNKKQMKFHDIYGFYSVYSTKPMEKISNQRLLENLNIGLNNVPMYYSEKAYIEEISLFREAVYNAKKRDYLYNENISEIEFMGDTLFKTDLIFPKKIPYGVYNVEIYLISDDDLVGVQSIPVEVKRTGFESYIYNLAHDNALLYGIICVLAALFAGWFANIIFWKV